MTHSLRLSFPSSAFQSSTSSLRRRAPGFRFPCFSTQTNSEDESIPCRKQSILVERYSNGAIKRYILDDGSGVRSSFEEDLVTDYELQGSFEGEGKERPWPLPRVVADFVLPAGYPGALLLKMMLCVEFLFSIADMDRISFRRLFAVHVVTVPHKCHWLDLSRIGHIKSSQGMRH
ncbi:hypothetical protein LINPERHAP1_LOCUS41111 [Linum perenne]